MTGGYDIMIVGIGGQGTILASNILGGACLIEKRSVRGAETHGMAQRGGSVESHIRIDGRYGPMIAPGTADLLIGFDMLEALRFSHFLKDGGRMVVNHRMVIPTSVYVQKLPLPSEEEIISQLAGKDLCLIDADAIAREAGSPLSANVVMLGAASHHIPLAADSLLMAIQRLVPPNTVVINTKAFELGRAAGQTC
ncbi:MAG: indolepyruvate oxidoreductase subunit beta [Methanomicrobiales archaeon]|nr:indolepyruvate oxidoreductase subunit beta [Methanomicrobiales archaeon]